MGKGGQHQVDATGQRQLTFPGAQTLAGQMQGDQRRGTGGIHRQRWPL